MNMEKKEYITQNRGFFFYFTKINKKKYLIDDRGTTMRTTISIIPPIQGNMAQQYPWK
jgi:hypothetical protein